MSYFELKATCVAENMMISNEISDQKDFMKRVPKPLMEKRRRDRINQSLETLRLLLVENTCNEKLKNPKVEKAEILESVVNFLKDQQSRTYSYPVTRGKRKYMEEDELGSPCKRQLNYQDGMRTCLLRVSNFIASKSQYMDGNMQQDHPAPALYLRQDAGSKPEQQALTHAGSTSYCMALSPTKISQITAIYEPTKKIDSCSKQPLMSSDSVWRPWPK